MQHYRNIFFKHLGLQFTIAVILKLGAATASGQVALVSVNRAGTGGNGASNGAKISAGGRFVVFSSEAGDLVANDNNDRADVFVRDLLTGTTSLVSVSSTGTGSGDGDSFAAIISANGRYVIFTSFAGNLVTNDANGLPDLFVRDLAAETTTLVSINRSGTGSGNNPTLNSVDPSITPDGRFVAFHSNAGDLVAGDDNNVADLFVRDLVAGKTILVSVNRAGAAAGVGSPFTPAISGDGRFVAFQSGANDLVANDLTRGGGFNQETDVFLRDMTAGTTSLISINRTGAASGSSFSRFPAMSTDGRFIVFESAASDLTANDTNLYRDVYVRDRDAGTTTLVSINMTGTTNNAPSNTIGAPAISADGRVVVFASSANDLVADDTNRFIDVFARDLQAGKTLLVSRNGAGRNGGNNDSQNPLISADGRLVTFRSLASDLAPESDANSKPDIFVRDLQAGTTALISVDVTGNASGNGSTLAAAISADGRRVVFDSDGNNLVADDANNLPDVFIRAEASSAAPTLLTEENSERAIALDSVTLLRDPFTVITTRNLSADGRTRIMFFAVNLDLIPSGEASAVTAEAEDSQRRIYPLTIEHIGEVPNFYWLKQVIVKLPDQLERAGDVRVSIKLRSRMSNRVLISIVS